MASKQLELSTLKCIFVPNFMVSYRLEQLGQNRAVNLLRTIAPGDDARLQPGTMCVQYMGGGGILRRPMASVQTIISQRH